MGKNGNIIAGLDIGTTKICAIIGERTGEGVDIIGFGTHPSKGLKKGMVVNVESTMDSIRHVIDDAEEMAGCEISSVYTGISGSHIKSFNCQGVIALRNREVKKEDVKRAIHASKEVTIPLDREILHVLPQEFIVDDQDGIKDPVGLSGSRLEARVHIVTGAVSSVQNIIKCANKTGLNVKDIVLQQLASSESVLNDDEKELGVVLVDLGGGTTDIVIYLGASIRYTAVLPLGGNHITSDIAVGLRTPLEDAEEIKKQHGCAVSSLIDKSETIEVPCIGGGKPRTVFRQLLGEVIEPRAEEILSLVHKEVIKSGYKDLLTSGVVLTGGASLLEGISELTEQIFNLPVRVGYPRGVNGLSDVVHNPIYSTGVGLILYGMKHHSGNGVGNGNGKDVWKTLKDRMRRWFKEVV
jgi:cell division protein FtsA